MYTLTQTTIHIPITKPSEDELSWYTYCGHFDYVLNQEDRFAGFQFKGVGTTPWPGPVSHMISEIDLGYAEDIFDIADLESLRQEAVHQLNTVRENGSLTKYRNEVPIIGLWPIRLLVLWEDDDKVDYDTGWGGDPEYDYWVTLKGVVTHSAATKIKEVSGIEYFGFSIKSLETR